MPQIANSPGHEPIVAALLASPEPSIRWKTRTQVLDEPPDAPEIVRLRTEIRDSDRVRQLRAPSRAPNPPAVYVKWQGAHRVLAVLADLGYPPGGRLRL